jgi:hypothetical protein
MKIEQIIQKMINEGVVTQEELDKSIADKKAEYEAEPPTVVKTLQTRTQGMQNIDKYTLDELKKLKDRVTALEGGTA